MTFKALLEAFAETKDALRAEWILDEMRDYKVNYVINSVCLPFHAVAVFVVIAVVGVVFRVGFRCATCEVGSSLEVFPYFFCSRFIRC